MPGQTPRFRFTTFDSAADTLSFAGHKFGTADRVLLDRLLTQAAERHTHIGSNGPQVPGAPPPAPLTNAYSTGGAIPASAVLYYRTVVVDNRGQDGPASQISSVTTIPPVFTPGPITIVAQPGPAGVLLPGDYVYAVSAYTAEAISETNTSPRASVLLSAIGQITITFPPLPSGATGFNVYRKGPTDTDLRYLISIPADTPTWADTGSLKSESLRGAPTRNTTNSTNSVTIAAPEALPDDCTLKIYRTYSNNNWDDSLLTWTAVLPVTDTGHATRPGAPSSNIMAIGDPSRIVLADETTGTPPPATTPTTTIVNWSFKGHVQPGPSTWQWINEFDQARVQTLRATIGRDTTPAGRPVKVALERRARNTGTWERFRTSAGDITADIPMHGQVSNLIQIPPNAMPGTILVQGDALRGVVVHSGGTATPTDFDLTISTNIVVRQGSPGYSYTVGAGYETAPGGTPPDIYDPDASPDGGDGGDGDGATEPLDPADGPAVTWTVGFTLDGQATPSTSSNFDGYTVSSRCDIATVAWSGAGTGNQTIIERLRAGSDWTEIVRITQPAYSGDFAQISYGQLKASGQLQAGDLVRIRMRTGPNDPPYTVPQTDLSCTLGLLKYGGSTPADWTTGQWAPNGKATWEVTFTYNASSIPEHGTSSFPSRDAYGVYSPRPGTTPSVNARVLQVAWIADDAVEAGLFLNNSGMTVGPYVEMTGGGSADVELLARQDVLVFAECAETWPSASYVVTMEDDADTADNDTTIPMNIPW